MSDDQIETPTIDEPKSNQQSDSPKFHGSGGEFFGIWIVNIIFSILTLGIYTAWAKVRVRRYFAVMTSFREERFDYHASAWPILKGRIIAFILFSTYVAAGRFSPVLAVVALVIMMLLFPFLVMKSFQFNANNTSYRNIRFKFIMPKKDQWASYAIAITPILLTLVSSNLLVPQEVLQSKDALKNIPIPFFFLVGFSFIYSMFYYLPFFMNWLYMNLYNNLYFGDIKVSFDSSFKELFKKVVLPYLALFFGLIISLIVLSILAAKLSPIIIIIAMPIIYIGFLVMSLIFPYLVQVYIWNNIKTTAGEASCDLPLKSYILKSIGLTLAMGLTLGFAYPWVRISFLKLFYSHRHFNLTSLDEVSQTDPATASALAEEVGESFDFDFDIGL